MVVIVGARCSDFGEELDGPITGTPVFRFAFQQVLHLFPNVAEMKTNYYPPSCELLKIMNQTIAFCDPLDGKTDGVVSRTDLCELKFNMSSVIGKPYSCTPSQGNSEGGEGGFGPTAMYPVENGTVSAEGIKLASTLLDGLRGSDGKLVYFLFQYMNAFSDAQTEYDSTSKAWELGVSAFGGGWVERYLKLQNSSTLDLDGVTYDTLKERILRGWQMYEDSLQTTWPDLTPFYVTGGKVLHFHGESDSSIPPASSVRYHESVRKIMYPGMSYNASNSALGEWYKLYLVLGADHCAPNSFEPIGPFPQTNLAVMIDWVENGVAPTTLNATVPQGQHVGENEQICSWPLRPLWTGNGTDMQCVYDQASIDTWHYDLNAIKLPVYEIL